MNPERASYRDIHDWRGGGLLDRMAPFIGHSMAAGWNLLMPGGSYAFGRDAMMTRDDAIQRRREYIRADYLPDARRDACRKATLIYVVWSYSTDVATYDPETDESYVSPNYWGMTTAKHLGYARRALPRVRSNAPEAIDGIGPGCPVVGEALGQPGGWRVAEVYPLAKAVRCETYAVAGWPDKVVPVKSVALA